MGNFFQESMEFGIIEQCLQRGLLQKNGDYDLACRLDELIPDDKTLSFLRGLVLTALSEQRWCDFIIISTSNFSKNFLEGYCSAQHASGIRGFSYDHQNVILECGVSGCDVTTDLNQHGVVAIVEGVITPDNYPALEALRQKLYNIGLHNVFIFGIFLCDKKKDLEVDRGSFEVFITDEDIERKYYLENKIPQ